MGLTCRGSSWRDSAIGGSAVSSCAAEWEGRGRGDTWHCGGVSGVRGEGGGRTDLVLAGDLIALDLPGSEKGDRDVCIRR